MLHQGRSRLAAAALAAGLTGGWSTAAGAQSIEPRAYSPAPTGANFLILAYTQAQGAPSLDTSLPVKDARLDLKSPVFAYVRSLDIGGKAMKVDVIIPVGELSGSAIYQGQSVSRRVQGFGDPLMRASVILSGASAMTAAEMKSYRQDVIVGASLQVSIPVGQYDPDRLLNLGSHRWSFKPEIGISKALGRWTLEAQAAGTFFTDNEDFFGGSRRSVTPIYSFQLHGIYALRSGAWFSLDGTFFTGGRTRLDGEVNNDRQRNWRLGGTLAIPLTRRSSLKLNASTGFWARTGNNFDLLGIACQYRWGGGL